MPKQHFRKAVSMIVLVMFLFSMAVFYSPSYQSNLAGMADWKDEPVTQNGNPITIGQGMKEITLYPVDDEGNYEGYKEAGTGKLKVKFKVDDSGKATLVKAYAKKPFIMGGDERECGNANQCKQMMDTEMEPKDKDDFNKMVGAFETGYAQQNPSTEPAPPPESNVEEDEEGDGEEAEPEPIPETTDEDKVTLPGFGDFKVEAEETIPGYTNKATKVSNEKGNIYYYNEEGTLVAYSENGELITDAMAVLEKSENNPQLVTLGTIAKTNAEEQKKAKAEAEAKAEEDKDKKEEEEEEEEEEEKKEEEKEEKQEEQKPIEQKSSSKIGGLDTEGDVFVCEDDDNCDAGKASFTFKHHSVFQGTEGYVYATADGKRCTAADAASGGDCAKRKCDNVKGCVHESEGSIYCTTFDGLKRCAGDPTGYIEKTIEACDKKAYAGPECTGAQKKMDATYDNLNFEFRSRVESVFGTLLDDWTENAFSRLEYWLYDSVCTMDYYNTGESETDVISGLTITQEHNFGFNLGYLDEGEVIVTLGGEKEVVDENAFRYSFTLQTIGPIHGIVYLYNHCTKKKSFGSEYTGAYGWMDEFAVNNPLGVHRIHYAGDETTFVCDGDGTNFKKQECRFDHVCLKILDNDKYVKPICNVLGGEEFIIDVDNGDYGCGQMPANYYKS